MNPAPLFMKLNKVRENLNKKWSGMKPFPLFFFGAVIGLVVLGIISGDRSNKDVLPTQESKIQEDLIEATLTVEEKVYQVSLFKGSSAYDLMVRAQETYGLQFKGKEFPGLGFFIQEINDLEQSPRFGKYWIYYINGTRADVGISVYIVNTHDNISWKYENEE